MAVREGFEPSIRDKPDTPLAGERLRPLGHLTNGANNNGYEKYVKQFFSFLSALLTVCREIAQLACFSSIISYFFTKTSEDNLRVTIEKRQ